MIISKRNDFTKLFDHYFERTDNSCHPKKVFISIFSDDKPKSKQTPEKGFRSPLYKTEVGIRWANFLIQQSQKQNHFSKFKKDMSFLNESKKISKVYSFKENKSMHDLLLPMIKKIRKKYSYIRNVFDDGNTFFRAIGFSFLEQMLCKDNMEDLLDFLTMKLPSTLFISPTNVMNETKQTENTAKHQMLMGEYMIEKLANIAHQCIESCERDQKEESSDDSEKSSKKKEKEKVNRSNLLRNLFNNDKFFDFSVVMFVRTMLYDSVEGLPKKKKDMIQSLCEDVGRKITANDEILKAMAPIMHSEIGYFRNQEDYGSYNKNEGDNSCIQLFVEEGKNNIAVHLIAYSKKFAKNSLLLE